MKLRKLVLGLLAAGCLAPGLASATNGYFHHGYGLKAKGMAGVGTAMAVDTFGGANNPASMVWVGNRIDFNILAPGVVQDHVTFGFTYKTATGGELTFAYMHAFNHGVTAPSLLNSFVPPGVSAGSASIKMYQNAVGVAYGWKM